jgi:aminopeptidase N
MTRILAALAALVALAALAEPRFSFDAAPGSLPKNIVPRHYDLWLQPDVASGTFKGVSRIDVDFREPARVILLHAHDLAVAKATIDGEPLEVVTDAKEQVLWLLSHERLPRGSHRVELEYTGKITTINVGLWRLSYRDSAGSRVMLGTQLEPAEARRIFPSWDEPAFRATFALTAVIPAEWKAVGNMPVKSERPAGEKSKEVAFETTPRMPTYLFAFFAGDFEEASGMAGSTPIRVIAPRGRLEPSAFALDVTRKALAFYEDYFGVPYALPKLDSISRPGGPVTAMENWGALAYHESYLRVDPSKDRLFLAQNGFRLIAHEIAHQWFGNLVTMGWWDNQWLNEGFATWMAAKVEDTLQPDWNTWARLKPRLETTMAEDALGTSHPVQQELHSVDKFVGLDNITYWKGAAVIRMLERYLGEDTFRAGIRAYIAEHRLSNTTAGDLWHHLEKASGKPVASFGEAWTKQAGFPVVKVSATCRQGKTLVRLEQQRFALNDPRAAPQTWPIPVNVEKGGAVKQRQAVLLEAQPQTLAFDGCGGYLTANPGDAGYYRVAYDRHASAALARDIGSLGVPDRIGLLADAWALVEAGLAPPAHYLEFASALRADPSVEVWTQQVALLQRIDRLQGGQPGQKRFRAWAASLLRGPMQRLGWEARPGEAARDWQLRGLLVNALGRFDDADTIAESRRLFDAHVRSVKPLHAELEAAVIFNVGRHADEAQYDALAAMMEKATVQDERLRYLRALQFARAPALAKRTLALSWRADFPAADAASNGSFVAEDSGHTQLAWDALRENHAAIAMKLSPAAKKQLAPRVARYFNDAERSRELMEFVRESIGPAGEEEARKAAVQIELAAAVRKRALPALDAWIAANPR